MATDGLSDSFENPESEFRVFARSLSERVASFGIERIGAALPGWLDGYSRDGSGDDMTLAIALLNPAGDMEPGQETPAGPTEGATSGGSDGPAEPAGGGTGAS
jgi:hypothetical protein